VQKRLSRKKVHRAFDDLLASAGSADSNRGPPSFRVKDNHLTRVHGC
jgi:hypothetical protein